MFHLVISSPSSDSSPSLTHSGVGLSGGYEKNYTLYIMNNTTLGSFHREGVSGRKHGWTECSPGTGTVDLESEDMNLQPTISY